MREPNAGAVRERQNQRQNTTTHEHEDPKPRLRADGKRSWCCPKARAIAREQGKFDGDEYVGDYE